MNNSETMPEFVPETNAGLSTNHFSLAGLKDFTIIKPRSWYKPGSKPQKPDARKPEKAPIDRGSVSGPKTQKPDARTPHEPDGRGGESGCETQKPNARRREQMTVG